MGSGRMQYAPPFHHGTHGYRTSLFYSPDANGAVREPPLHPDIEERTHIITQQQNFVLCQKESEKDVVTGFV